MEDAMIINKSAFERGLAHGQVIKTEFVELQSSKDYFALNLEDKKLEQQLRESIANQGFPLLDSDGLPSPGVIIREKEPYYR